MDLNKIKVNPNNPRIISKEKFEKLKKSIQSFPKMLELRPIIIDKDGMILGGNMRFRALQELKWEIKNEWVKVADKLTDEEKRRFIVEDNIEFGEFDFDVLSSNYEANELLDWGIDEKGIDMGENIYTQSVQSPVYEPHEENKPDIGLLVDQKKSKELIAEIEKSNLSDQEKEFLKVASYRHNVFDYSIIAEYYAHSNEETKKLFEKSALVIIDFKSAIANGYVKLSKYISDFQGEDYD